MANKLVRTRDGTLVPYGVFCNHLWFETGLHYYAVFQPGEEQPDCYCEECYERLQQGHQMRLGRCCLYCAREVLARHILVGEVEAS